jgi:hypothetical protein
MQNEFFEEPMPDTPDPLEVCPGFGFFRQQSMSKLSASSGSAEPEPESSSTIRHVHEGTATPRSSQTEPLDDDDAILLSFEEAGKTQDAGATIAATATVDSDASTRSATEPLDDDDAVLLSLEEVGKTHDAGAVIAATAPVDSDASTRSANERRPSMPSRRSEVRISKRRGSRKGFKRDELRGGSGGVGVVYPWTKVLKSDGSVQPPEPAPCTHSGSKTGRDPPPRGELDGSSSGELCEAHMKLDDSRDSDSPLSWGDFDGLSSGELCGWLEAHAPSDFLQQQLEKLCKEVEMMHS